ncbi:glycoside hydrolase family 88/105 protein [Portibacter lacus]|nr:glycoside hydrolase family 88 protein [Portibacter lacus]
MNNKIKKYKRMMRTWKRVIYSVACVFVLIAFKSCTQLNSQQLKKIESISEELPWSERMALSIMKRNDRLFMIESRTDPKWSYTHGLVAQSILEVYKTTENEKYFVYAKGYADDLISPDGVILGYNITDFNIDNINPGKYLFDLHKKERNEKYRIAMETLRNQIEWQPRNTKGGFWHKLRYPWQMWLDGLYMGGPFYARYAKEHGAYEDFDDIAKQFMLLEEYAKEKQNGLFYHGWDESKLQKWSNQDTGLSPHFWSRAIGWYAMALVDVLDYFPEDHPNRKDLIRILNNLMESITPFQDKETGLWSQIMDLPEKEGNYQEATGTAMFSYVMLKSVRLGYIDQKFYQIGAKAHSGLTEHLIVINNDGEINLTKCCAVAGLGGTPYRDGSYDYYVNEEIRSNDPKGTGPFILASLELEKSQNKTK